MSNPLQMGQLRYDDFGMVPKGVARRYYAADAAKGRADGRKLGLLDNTQHSGALGADYFSNPSARMGWGTPSLTEGTQYDLVRLSYNYMLLVTLYRNHWICKRIVDGPAQDMVKAWPRLTSDLEPKDLTKLDQTIRRTQTKNNTLKALKWGRLFGGAGALIVIDGQEKRLDEPLDLDEIEIGSYRGLIPFDRWTGISPVGNLASDINKPIEFNLPEYYDVCVPQGGKNFRVHASRVLRFTGPTVPAPEYQAQNYWGISVIEPAFEEIRKRDNLSWNILQVSFRASLLAMEWPDLAQHLSGASSTMLGQQRFLNTMTAMNSLISNNSMLFLPKDGKLNSVSQSMTGWSDILGQFQMDIAGAAQTTVTRLFGRTVTGLGQLNDADERLYEEFIASEQEDLMRPQMEKLYSVVCMSALGDVPEDLDMSFPSVRVLTEEEKAKLATDTTACIVSLFNTGIIGKAHSLKELKQSSDVTGFGTNVTDEDIDKAEKQGDLESELAADPEDDPGEKAVPNGGKPDDGGVAAPKSLKATASAKDSSIWEQFGETAGRHYPSESGINELPADWQIEKAFRKSTETIDWANFASNERSKALKQYTVAFKKAFGKATASAAKDSEDEPVFLATQFAGIAVTIEASGG